MTVVNPSFRVESASVREDLKSAIEQSQKFEAKVRAFQSNYDMIASKISDSLIELNQLLTEFKRYPRTQWVT